MGIVKLCVAKKVSHICCPYAYAQKKAPHCCYKRNHASLGCLYCSGACSPNCRCVFLKLYIKLKRNVHIKNTKTPIARPAFAGYAFFCSLSACRITADLLPFHADSSHLTARCNASCRMEMKSRLEQMHSACVCVCAHICVSECLCACAHTHMHPMKSNLILRPCMTKTISWSRSPRMKVTFTGYPFGFGSLAHAFLTPALSKVAPHAKNCNSSVFAVALAIMN